MIFKELRTRLDQAIAETRHKLDKARHFRKALGLRRANRDSGNQTGRKEACVLGVGLLKHGKDLCLN
jgi:hypothetical protein